MKKLFECFSKRSFLIKTICIEKKRLKKLDTTQHVLGRETSFYVPSKADVIYIYDLTLYIHFYILQNRNVSKVFN